MQLTEFLLPKKRLRNLKKRVRSLISWPRPRQSLLILESNKVLLRINKSLIYSTIISKQRVKCALI